MATVTDPIILDSTGQAIKNSIDLLSANINRTASNIPYDSNLTIKGKIDAIDLTSGGTIKGLLKVDAENGTPSVEDYSVIMLGNNIPTGTDKNSTGIIRLYSSTGNFVNFYANPINSSNKYITLPDKSGTIALTSDITVNTFDLNVDVTANTTATTNVNWGNIDRNKVLYSWVWWSNPTSDSPIAITTYYNGTGVGALNQIVHRWPVTQTVRFKICYIYKA